MHSSALMKSVWTSRPVSPQELHHLKQNKFKYFFLFAKVETQRFNCTRPEMWLYGTFVCSRIKVGSYVKIIHWISDGWSSSAYQTLKPHLPSAGKAEVFNTKLTFWVSAVSQIQDFDRSPNITRVLFPTEKPEIIKGNLEHKKENAKWNRWPEFKLRKTKIKNQTGMLYITK